MYRFFYKTPLARTFASLLMLSTASRASLIVVAFHIDVRFINALIAALKRPN